MSAEGFLFVRICIRNAMTSLFLLFFFFLGKSVLKQNISFLQGHKLCQILIHMLYSSPQTRYVLSKIIY